MYKILDGKELAKKLKIELTNRIQTLPTPPTLAVIQLGDNKDAQVYTKKIQKLSQDTGIRVMSYPLPDTITEYDLLELIKALNQSSEVHGILLHMPLPSHINAITITSSIDIAKDVDCLNPHNIGLLSQSDKGYAPCTPLGIVTLLKAYNLDLASKNCVIIGRSNVVGRPLASMLLGENTTVTICHSYTKNLEYIASGADILISAVGKKDFITANMVQHGAVVIDAGINVDEMGAVCGDVAFDKVKHKVSYITPVPGGVGPMTNVMLLRNLLNAYTTLTNQ